MFIVLFCLFHVIGLAVFVSVLLTEIEHCIDTMSLNIQLVNCHY